MMVRSDAKTYKTRQIKAGVVTYEYVPSHGHKGYELLEAGGLKNALMVPPILPSDVPLLMTLDPLAQSPLSFHITLNDDVCVITSVALTHPNQSGRKNRKITETSALLNHDIPQTPWWGGRQVSLIISRTDWDKGPYDIFLAAEAWHKQQQSNRFAALSERQDTSLRVALPGAPPQKTCQPHIHVELEHHLDGSLHDWLETTLVQNFTSLSWGFSAALIETGTSIFASGPFQTPPTRPLAPDFRQFENHLINGISKGAADYLSALDQAVTPVPNQLNVFRPGTIAIAAAIDSAAQKARCFAPSALLEISRYRWLSQAVFDAIIESPQENVLDTFTAGVVAALHLSNDASLSARILARFARADQYMNPQTRAKWHKSDWITMTHIPQNQRMVLQRLNSDALVTDIDRTWGEGSAMALGQKLAGALRKPDHHFEPDRRQVRPSLTQLSADSPVMGRA